LAKLRENRAKHKLQRGEVVTVISGFNSPDMIDYLGQFGFDAVWIETEHGPIDYADIPDMTRACDLWGMTSIVRVNQNVEGIIYRTFDVGAQGVVVPHVNTAEEARAVVHAGKFAPIGARGMYGSRQSYGVADYFAKANDETLLVVLIEDIVAVRNLPEILKVDHIDVFFVAPSDLAQSMGLIGQLDHPEVVATIDKAIGQIVGAGRVAGALVNDATVEDAIKKGARFIMTGWPAWVASGARGYLKRVASVAR
jgi:4-hydroxy-2-oxoheptanedioate aldolase